MALALSTSMRAGPYSRFCERSTLPPSSWQVSCMP
jgi:hypothetical protein